MKRDTTATEQLKKILGDDEVKFLTVVNEVLKKVTMGELNEILERLGW